MAAARAVRYARPMLTAETHTASGTEHADGLSSGLTFVFALAAGALVANLYYAQALVTVISPALGLHAGLAGLTVTLTQLGYAAGLALLVSLADLVENRRLILICVGGTVLGLVGAAFSTNAATFLISSIVIGVVRGSLHRSLFRSRRISRPTSGAERCSAT